MHHARSAFLDPDSRLRTGLAGVASAQYSNTPGVYTNVGVGVVPAALPPGSLPGDLPALGPNLYRGTLTVLRNFDNTYAVSTAFSKVIGVYGFSFSNRKIYPRSAADLAP